MTVFNDNLTSDSEDRAAAVTPIDSRSEGTRFKYRPEHQPSS